MRTLVRAKSFSLRSLKVVGQPIIAVGRIILPRLVVPLYHSLYLLRRRLDHWYRPAKNKFMYALANRHMLHIIVVVIALVAGLVNFQLSTVRAETYGERSLMYSLVTHNEQQLIDEYADVTRTNQSAPVKYLAGSTLTPSLGANSIQDNEQLSGSSVIGSSSLAALAIANGSASIAPRELIETYTVSSGDTLSTIAGNYGISLNTLLWANNLTSRSLVKPGQTLTILPVSGVAHTIKKGDTLAQISKKYGVDQTKILSYNKLADNSTLSVGQQVLIPGGVVQPVVAKPPVSRVLTATPTKTTPSTARNTGAAMLWPTDLSYIVRGLSWSHSGLDIDCNGHSNGSSTNDNYAAAAGTVSYAGWRNGYGNTVEIQHSNGLMTRYGHHYSLYVKTGQIVAAGTPLGRCGSTGTSTGTHLHFEVIGTGGRKDFRNPLEYIR